MRVSYLYSKFFKKILRGKSVIKSKIDKTATIASGCQVVNSSFNRYSYCGYDCVIINCDIGKFCSLADFVFIGGAEHPMNWVSTSPVFQKVKHSGPAKRFAEYELVKPKRTLIGNDVWIGHGATVLQGVCIGDGAIVGCNAVVTKDVPPYAVVAGVPAKIIKYRFSQEIINRLVEIKWWNFSDNEISKYAQYIRDSVHFIRHVEMNKSDSSK